MSRYGLERPVIIRIVIIWMVSYDQVGVLYSGKLANKSEARASDLRSYPGLWWNRIKQRLYEGKESEYLLNWQTCRGHFVSPPIILH